MHPVLPQPASCFDLLLRDARRGQSEALGQILEACRPYLQLLAKDHLRGDLRRKVGASDLVQLTCLDAQQSFEAFEGRTRAEFQAWVERILINNASDCARQFRQTGKRRLDREVEIDGGNGPPDIVGDDTTPSQLAIAREEAEILARALADLPDDYRLVIVLRNQEKRPFDEIGRLTHRSTDAAKKLWARAILALEKALRPKVAAAEA